LLFTIESAKEFLLSKLSAQAEHDGASLDDIEKRMFLFSEASGDPDLDAQEAFDAKYDDKAYETKVAKLLRKAYASDKQANGAEGWRDALKALERQDFYGLVMMDAAKIPRSKAGLWEFVIGLLPLAITELGIFVIGFFVVFRPSVLGLNLPDWARWLAYPLFVWLLWYVGQVSSRIRMAKTVKRSQLPNN